MDIFGMLLLSNIQIFKEDVVVKIIGCFLFGSGLASIVSFGILGMVAAIAFFIPGLAIGFRRFQDLNWPGWWIIVFNVLAMIPLVNLSVFYWIYLFCQKGDEGANDYGKPVL